MASLYRVRNDSITNLKSLIRKKVVPRGEKSQKLIRGYNTYGVYDNSITNIKRLIRKKLVHRGKKCQTLIRG